MAPSRSAKQNRILAGLPPADYACLLPHLDLVCLPAGEGIYYRKLSVATKAV